MKRVGQEEGWSDQNREYLRENIGAFAQMMREKISRINNEAQKQEMTVMGSSLILLATENNWSKELFAQWWSAYSGLNRDALIADIRKQNIPMRLLSRFETQDGLQDLRHAHILLDDEAETSVGSKNIFPCII